MALGLSTFEAGEPIHLILIALLVLKLSVITIRPVKIRSAVSRHAYIQAAENTYNSQAQNTAGTYLLSLQRVPLGGYCRSKVDNHKSAHAI